MLLYLKLFVNINESIKIQAVKKTLLTCFVLLFIMACSNDKQNMDEERHKNVKRVGMVVKIKKEMVEEYKNLHADNNPGVRHLLSKYHMRNFSIFLVQLGDGEWYEFGYYEYWGNDLEGDMTKLDAEPENARWLEQCDPMQEGILPGQKGWKVMDRIYYNY
jgi:L-rhamnose mutarotase